MRKLRLESYVSTSRSGAFAVAHMGRCGSTVLGDMLAQHPEIGWRGEVYGAHFSRMVKTGNSDSRKRANLNRLLRADMKLVETGWFGFDYVLSQLRLVDESVSQHAHLLRRAGFTRFVILERRNLLRRLVSELAAKSSGIWHSTSNGAHLTKPQFEINVSTDEAGEPRVFRLFNRWESYYRALHAEHVHDETLGLTYEDDIASDPSTACQRVTHFLGLALHSPTINLQRLNTGAVLDGVSNADEVTEMLSGTKYEWMLHSDK